MKSVIGNRRTIMRSAGDQGSTETTARPKRKTSARDVTPVSDSIKQALSGRQDDGDSDDNRKNEAE